MTAVTAAPNAAIAGVSLRKVPFLAADRGAMASPWEDRYEAATSSCAARSAATPCRSRGRARAGGRARAPPHRLSPPIPNLQPASGGASCGSGPRLIRWSRRSICCSATSAAAPCGASRSSSHRVPSARCPPPWLQQGEVQARRLCQSSRLPPPLLVRPAGSLPATGMVEPDVAHPVPGCVRPH